MPGPAKEPTALRVLKGNPGKRALNKDEPQPAVGVGDPPEWLDADAKRYWSRFAPMLERLGVLTESDVTEFEVLCTTYAAWRAAVKKLRKHGRYDISESGASRPSGYFRVERQLAADYNRVAGKFGLTPSDRTGIKAISPGTKLPDPLGLMQ